MSILGAEHHRDQVPAEEFAGLFLGLLRGFAPMLALGLHLPHADGDLGGPQVDNRDRGQHQFAHDRHAITSPNRSCRRAKERVTAAVAHRRLLTPHIPAFFGTPGPSFAQALPAAWTSGREPAMADIKPSRGIWYAAAMDLLRSDARKPVFRKVRTRAHHRHGQPRRRAAGAERTTGAAGPAAKSACHRSAFRVVIDVGHTIDSPGADSARGVPEYQFNLALAGAIKDKLAEAGFDNAVRLVTTTKHMAGLVERPARANAMHADLFIAVHHDSVPDNLIETWEYEGQKHRFSDRFSGYSIFVSIDNGDYKGSLAFGHLLGTGIAGARPALHAALHAAADGPASPLAGGCRGRRLSLRSIGRVARDPRCRRYCWKRAPS